MEKTASEAPVVVSMREQMAKAARSNKSLRLLITETFATIYEQELQRIKSEVAQQYASQFRTEGASTDKYCVDWISPVKKEREWQLNQLTELGLLPHSCPNWQILNTLLNGTKNYIKLQKELEELKEINAANVSHIEAANELCKEKDAEIEELKAKNKYLGDANDEHQEEIVKHLLEIKELKAENERLKKSTSLILTSCNIGGDYKEIVNCVKKYAHEALNK